MPTLEELSVDAIRNFRTLKHAQATGDLRTLQAHDRPVVRLRLDGDPAAAVRDLADRVRGGP